MTCLQFVQGGLIRKVNCKQPNKEFIAKIPLRIKSFCLLNRFLKRKRGNSLFNENRDIWRVACWGTSNKRGVKRTSELFWIYKEDNSVMWSCPKAEFTLIYHFQREHLTNSDIYNSVCLIQIRYSLAVKMNTLNVILFYCFRSKTASQIFKYLKQLR